MQTTSQTQVSPSFHEESKPKVMPPLAKIFVVDDDPVFRFALNRAAKAQGIALQAFDPDKDFYNLPNDGSFDVAIIDYDLGGLHGTQVSALYRETAVLLISGSRAGPLKDDLWPPSIRGFSFKNEGIHAILREGLRLGIAKEAV